MHDAGLYGSDAELADLVVPFVRDGLTAGEVTMLGATAETAPLLHGALGLLPGLVLLEDDVRRGDPLDVLAGTHRMLSDTVDAGAARIRMIAHNPRPEGDTAWAKWLRYEAVVNHFFAHLPLWAVCLYDIRTTPARCLAGVERTHPYLWRPGRGRRPNPRYTDPAALLAEQAQREVDEREHRRPDRELTNPSLGAGRLAVAELAGTTDLDAEAASGLVIAVNEVLTNAHVHGRPPVTLRAWAARNRLLVAVHDTGVGPADPFAGLLPRGAGAHGHGLWVAHQLCNRVTLAPGPDGFTVRLVAGATDPPAGRG